MNYPKSEKYAALLNENMMGPNAMKLLEELMQMRPVPQGSLVLDFGCGQGLTSLLLAKEYGMRVFAADLWIDPSDNKKRFDEWGLTPEQAVPLHVEAHELPFADDFFDAAVCVDAYHYFGLDEGYLGNHLLKKVKRGGYILIAVPGLIKDIHHDIPAEMRESWTAEDIETLHDGNYWRRILEKTEGARIEAIAPMQGYAECWQDWLGCDNEYAVNDRRAMRAGAGRYMNLLAIIIRRE